MEMTWNIIAFFHVQLNLWHCMVFENQQKRSHQQITRKALDAVNFAI